MARVTVQKLMYFKEPIIIIGAPRSGTTFLKELLSAHREIWHLPGESHSILEGPLHPKYFKEFSNQPDAKFTLEKNQIEHLNLQFYQKVINVNTVPNGKFFLDAIRGNRYGRKIFLIWAGMLSKSVKSNYLPLRFLEKTPRNCVRIPIINQIFPDAKYIFLQRNPVENINSIVRGWQSQSGLLQYLFKRRPRFASAGYRIPALSQIHSDEYWRFILPPGWQNENFEDIIDISIFQYLKSNEIAQKDLRQSVDKENVFMVDYENLSQNTTDILGSILDFSGLEKKYYDFEMLDNMPKINTTKNKSSFDLETEIVGRLSERGYIRN